MSNNWRKQDDYATNQVRLLLTDLKNGSHSVKMKSIQHFQTYISTFIPEISDDGVDLLFQGNEDLPGILSYCGTPSEKHSGQLKRICGPLMSLVRWLISFEHDTIYLDRFIRVPLSTLEKMNFYVHVNSSSTSLKKSSTNGTSRGGSAEDAFEILACLLNDHLGADDEPEDANIPGFLHNDRQCIRRFEDWLRQSNVEHLQETLQVLKNGGRGKGGDDDNNNEDDLMRELGGDDMGDDDEWYLTGKIGRGKKNRIIGPTLWDDVYLENPFQTDEELITPTAGPPPIPDPLGLGIPDLRQLASKSFHTVTGLGGGGRGRDDAYVWRRLAGSDSEEDSGDELSGGEGDGSDDETVRDARARNRRGSVMNRSMENMDEYTQGSGLLTGGRKNQPPGSRSGRSVKMNILPTEKGFSVVQFLTLVHGGTGFDQLREGLNHLDESLSEKSDSRAQLVRSHFGLFVQCANGLEWLKSYRRGVIPTDSSSSFRGRQLTANPSEQLNLIATAGSGGSGVVAVPIKGMERLKRSQDLLDSAKEEAKSTLGPILERMKGIREIRSAEKVLRGMSSILEFPHGMRTAYERGDHREVISLYQRVQAIPPTSALKLVDRVRRAADQVICDLQKHCWRVLLTPNPHFNTLHAAAQTILLLQGPLYYLCALRQCFLRQLLHFVEAVKESRRQFVVDGLGAYDKGEELSLQSRHSVTLDGNSSQFLSSPGGSNSGNENNGSEALDLLLGVVRKYASVMKSNSTAVLATAGGSKSAPRRLARRAGGMLRSTSTYGGGPYDSGDEAMEAMSAFEEELDDGNGGAAGGVGIDMGFEDWLSAPARAGFSLEACLEDYLTTSGILSSNNQPSVPSSTRPVTGGNAFSGGAAGVRDFVELTCAVARKAFVESLVELTAQWFNCLFRLSCEAVRFSHDSSAIQEVLHITHSNHPGTSGVPATATLPAGLTFTDSQNVRGGVAALATPAAVSAASLNVLDGFLASAGSRRGLSAISLLGSVLSQTSEFMYQAVNGCQSALRRPSLATELQSAARELSRCCEALQSGLKLSPPADFAAEFGRTNFFMSVPSGNTSTQNPIGIGGGTSSSTAAASLENSRFQDVAMAPAFRNPLNGAFYQGALSEAYALYEALEIALDTATTSFAATLPSPPPSGLLHSIGGQCLWAVARESSELSFRESSAPFFNPMQLLASLAREGELVAAQQVLTRCEERVSTLLDYTLRDISQENLLPSTSSNPNLTSNRQRIGAVSMFNTDDDSENIADPVILSLMGVESSEDLPTGVECSVILLEALLDRALLALRAHLRRPQWGSRLIYESLLGHVLTAFTNRLRHRALIIDSLLTPASSISAVSFNEGGDSNVSAVGSKAGLNQSITNDLASLEESLRQYSFVGWDRDMTASRLFPTDQSVSWLSMTTASGTGTTSVSQSHRVVTSAGTSSNALGIDNLSQTEKSSLWLDCLRGAVRFRTFSLPRLIKSASRHFPLNAIENNSSLFLSTSAPNPTNTTSPRSLARLFQSVDSEPLEFKLGSQDLDDELTNISHYQQIAPDSPHVMKIRIKTKQFVAGQVLSTFQKLHMPGRNQFVSSKLSSLVGGPCGASVVKFVKDLVDKEACAVSAYIEGRALSLRTVLFSGFTQAVGAELANSSTSPGSIPEVRQTGTNILAPHFSRLLLSLAEDRCQLKAMLGGMTVEAGNSNEFYRRQTREIIANPLTTAGTVAVSSGTGALVGDDVSSEESEDDGDEVVAEGDDILDFEIAPSPPPPPPLHHGSPIDYSPGRRASRDARPSALSTTFGDSQDDYARMLFAELCRAVLLTYEEIVAYLRENSPKLHPSLASDTPSKPRPAGESAPIIAIRTLTQVLEEYEALKILFTPVLNKERDRELLLKQLLGTQELIAVQRFRERLLSRSIEGPSIHSRDDIARESAALVMLMRA